MQKEAKDINKQPDWSKVQRDYKEWVSKIRILPSILYEVVALVALITGIFIYRQTLSWKGFYIAILFIAFVKSLCVVAERSGHKEGYNDGYRDGYEQGRDDVLGIDAEDRHFIDVTSKLP